MSVGIGLGDVCIALRGAFCLWAGVRAYSEDTRTVREEISLWKRRLEELDQRVRDTKLSPGAAGIAKRDLLESFKTLEQIEKYLCSPTTKGSAHLNWAVYRRNKVMGYKENLNALMSRISETIITENVHHQAIMVPTNNLITTLPTQFKEEPVYLVDAMDEMVIFSAAFCLDLESLHTMIGLRFKQSKVASWMEQRRYEITNEATGARLGSDVHGNIVKPGMRLSMAMLLFLEKKSTEEAQHECPRCGKGYEGGTSGVLERVQCEKCRTFFQVSIEPRITEIDGTDTNTPPSGGLLEDENTSKGQTIGLTDENHRGIELFRRLHVLIRKLDEIAELGPKDFSIANLQMEIIETVELQSGTAEDLLSLAVMEGTTAAMKGTTAVVQGTTAVIGGATAALADATMVIGGATLAVGGAAGSMVGDATGAIVGGATGMIGGAIKNMKGRRRGLFR
ncbi:hypothetical protein DFP73DRAFT_631909 [Morchella snyderi]|nr:hypothetical protein DFP73DRAFT_631909 [Morchella snyderi]